MAIWQNWYFEIWSISFKNGSFKYCSGFGRGQCSSDYCVSLTQDSKTEWLRAGKKAQVFSLRRVHWTLQFVRYLLTIACEEQMQLSIVTIMTAAAASSYSMSQTAKIRGVQGQITNIIEIIMNLSIYDL